MACQLPQAPYFKVKLMAKAGRGHTYTLWFASGNHFGLRSGFSRSGHVALLLVTVRKQYILSPNIIYGYTCPRVDRGKTQIYNIQCGLSLQIESAHQMHNVNLKAFAVFTNARDSDENCMGDKHVLLKKSGDKNKEGGT